MTRRLYFRAFGLVYLVAFLSLWTQIRDLVGQHGILPVEQFLRSARASSGVTAHWMLPTLCWISSSDFMLDLLCASGALLSLVLLTGLSPRLTLFLLWLTYLSLTVAGQAFMRFQWDSLMLEMTICSILYAPRGWRPDWQTSVPSITCWPLWGLAFKLMFLSGATKLLSGDSSWLNGSALEFHCFTQPLPNWIAWYACQLPRSVLWFSLLIMFAIEVLFPFLVFAGRRGRIVFGTATILLMAAIEATGNFGFFNLQTVTLCIPLFDDSCLRRMIPRRWLSLDSKPSPVRPDGPWRIVAKRFWVATILVISFLTMVREVSFTARGSKLPQVVIFVIQLAEIEFLSWGSPLVLEPLSPFRTINGYGLFRVMSVERNEIIIETSDDGASWTPCEFRYKPGRTDRPPPIVAPHMPRLDWQMWFAAQNQLGSQNWLDALVHRILEGNPAAARLMGHFEWKSNPPKYVRLASYEYSFTTIDQRRSTGAWWRRRFLGNLTDRIERRAN